MQTKHRVFSGVQPSGAQVHLGNYLGAMKHFVTLAEQYETIVCLVDLHALTRVEHAESLRSNTQSLAAAYLAIGLDPSKTIIFRQSDVPEVCELSWYLACHFPLGLLERSHALKDVRARGVDTNAGLMFYPVLMAADILLYRATLVPVGPDQKQHIEMARDVVLKFNNTFGDTFPLPQPLIDETTGVIPGLDGRKMSKSYDNYIGLFESAKEVRKKVMRIVTDSKSVEEPKDPDSCNVFRFYKLFSTAEERQSLAERYRAGGVGYGHAKEELLAVMERTLSPLRERYEHWINCPGEVQAVLADGASRAGAIAKTTISDVRKRVGVK